MAEKTVTTSKAEVKAELWRRGQIFWLLRPHQRPIYDKIRQVLASDDPMLNSYVIDCARQFGKSFIMFMIAVETCLRLPRQTIVYVGPLKSQVNEIINGHTYNIMFQTCPSDLTPKYDGSTLIFPNGSRIRLAGTDNKNYTNLRGGAAHLVILDEAGFMSDLEVGVLPTVEPMTKTTGGKVIFASTPPDTLDHDYIQILRDHDEAGLISTYTIWDDKSLNEQQLQKIINQCRGQETTKFKREYECQRIVESSLQVVPELVEEKADKLKITNTYRTDPLLRYYHRYIVVDTGVRDKTAVVFAHYNYRTKKVIVEATLDLQGSEYNTAKLADMIVKKRNELWFNDSFIGELRYIADNNNLIVINDLNIIYKLPFIGTTKGRLDEMVQKVRDWVFDDRLLFAPEALDALNCARFAIWSKSRTEFARSAKYGHYDLLAALTYLIRNINEHKDPLPREIIDRTLMYVPPTIRADVTKARYELESIFFNPRKGLSYRE
jgi:hypothetical protein